MITTIQAMVATLHKRHDRTDQDLDDVAAQQIDVRHPMSTHRARARALDPLQHALGAADVDAADRPGERPAGALELGAVPALLCTIGACNRSPPCLLLLDAALCTLRHLVADAETPRIGTDCSVGRWRRAR